jgi:hypothetical protein
MRLIKAGALTLEEAEMQGRCRKATPAGSRRWPQLNNGAFPGGKKCPSPAARNRNRFPSVPPPEETLSGCFGQ